MKRVINDKIVELFEVPNQKVGVNLWTTNENDKINEMEIKENCNYDVKKDNKDLKDMDLFGGDH